MNPLRSLPLLACCLASACGDKPADGLLQDAAGRWRAAFGRTGSELGTAREALGDVGILVALDGGNAADLATLAALQGPGKLPLAACGPPSANPTEARAFGRTAFASGDAGAGVVVDLALLACNGVTLPGRLPLGSQWVAGTSLEPTPRLAPGDVIVQMLRSQNAGILTTNPATDEAHRVTLVVSEQPNDWQTGIRRAAEADGARYPQLDFDVCAVGSGAAEQTEAIRALLPLGQRVLILAVDEPGDLTAVLAEAAAAHAMVIVIDPLLRRDLGTCTIGTDQRILGACVADAVRSLAPAGGAVLSATGDPGLAWLAARYQGFVDALGLRPD